MEEIKRETYYQITWANYRSKFSPTIQNTVKTNYDDKDDLLRKGNISNLQWKMHVFYIVKNGLACCDDLSLLKDMWIDYCPNSFAIPMMSQRMKDIVDANLTGNEGVFWLPFEVEGNGEIRQYYILRFESRLYVLNKWRSIFWSNFLLEPVFKKKKVAKYSIVSCRDKTLWESSHIFYVSATLRRQLRKAKITGILYREIEIV